MRIAARQNEGDRRTLLEQGPVGPPHERWFLEGKHDVTTIIIVNYSHKSRADSGHRFDASPGLIKSRLALNVIRRGAGEKYLCDRG